MKEAQSPKIGVSSCLLGNKVRYDGEGKRQVWLVDELGKFVNFEAFCPEMAMGLGTPREALRIIIDSNTKELSLASSKTQVDRTDLAHETIEKIAASSNLDDLDGFVFMANSPLCGLSHVKVYESKNRIPHRTGVGFFAHYIKENLPHLPLTEHGRLRDHNQREAFLTHVFLYHKLRRLERSVRSLQKFHQDNKFLLLSYHPDTFRKLGPLVASADKVNLEQTIKSYIDLLAKMFAKPRKKSTGTDALLHMFGFFKKELSADQKKHALDFINAYNDGLVPISVPLSIIKFINSKNTNLYIQEQSIFSPFPNYWKFTSR